MRLFVRLFAFAMVMLLAALPASAVQPKGSAAWTTNGWISYDGTLYYGPGTNYPVSGSVTAGVRIRVDRCSGLWCEIRVGHEHGWFPLGDISFGQTPGGWFAGPRFPTEAGNGTVCFYTGANYTGRSLCADSGHVFPDLSFMGFDNVIASVKITGAANALVCRDRDYRYYCKVIDVSTRSLDVLLNRQVTSVKVN